MDTAAFISGNAAGKSCNLKKILRIFCGQT
jgi:hypothetical protein